MLKLLLIMTALTATPALAKDQVLVGIGFGTMTCQAISAALRQDKSSLTAFKLISWAQGWMTAANDARIFTKHNRKILSTPNPGEQFVYLATYCDSHPLQTGDAAVSDLFSRLPEVKGDVANHPELKEWFQEHQESEK